MIKYHAGYKYTLAESYSIQTAIRPERMAVTDFIVLDTDGLLHIRAGCPWDGPSGPTFDDDSNMRASLVHDALRRLQRMGQLDMKYLREVHRAYYDICIECGMPEIRADYHYAAIKKVDRTNEPNESDIVLTAP